MPDIQLIFLSKLLRSMATRRESGTFYQAISDDLIIKSKSIINIVIYQKSTIVIFNVFFDCSWSDSVIIKNDRALAHTFCFKGDRAGRAGKVGRAGQNGKERQLHVPFFPIWEFIKKRGGSTYYNQWTLVP